MLAKECEDLSIKDTHSSKTVAVSQSLLFQGEEGNQKAYRISLKKVVSISELWTYKQEKEEADSTQSFHYEQNVLYSSVYFLYQRRWFEIPIFI